MLDFAKSLSIIFYISGVDPESLYLVACTYIVRAPGEPIAKPEKVRFRFFKHLDFIMANFLEFDQNLP